MRNLLITAAVAALASASPAFAAPSNTADTTITATAPKTCSIDNASTAITLGAVGESKPGVFEYTCNFDGGKDVFIASDNGKVVTGDNGGASANYGVYLNTIPASGNVNSYDSASVMSPGSLYHAILNDGHGAKTASFAVGLKDALPVAGTYSDILHFTIQP